MGETSNAKTLQQRLKQKMTEDREQIEQLTQSEQQRLFESYRKHVDDVLSTIEADIESKAKRLRHSLLRPLTVGLVIGASLLVTVCVGSWGVLQLISVRIQSQMQRQTALSQEIGKQQQTLQQLQARTWGVSLYPSKDGRYVTFPKGVYKVWKVNGRMAVQIIREK